MGGKAALILVLGFGFIFGYIGIRINELESRAVGNSAIYLEVTTAHNLAVSGTNIALSKLYADTTLWYRGSDTILAAQTLTSGPFAGGAYASLFDWRSPVTIWISTASRYWAYGNTWRDTVIVAFRKLALWDILGLMVGFSGNDDTWITKDTMWGRVHFNGRVSVKGSPVYNDKVTVSKGFDPPVGTSINQAIFMNGYETGVGQLPLPQRSDTIDTFPFADTVIGDGTARVSMRFLDGLPVTNNDGIAELRIGNLHFHGGAPNAFYLFNLKPNKVILIRGDVSLKGVVDGRVTVAATGKIFLDSNLVYFRDPQVFAGSDDIIGLVAMGDVELYGGQPNFNIQAVIASIDGKMNADYPNTLVGGVFRNFGGIIARDRTNIAQYSGSDGGPNPYMTRGYYRRFRWDPRLVSPAFRPPHFPVPDNVPLRLQVVNWWENVRVPPF